MLVPAIGSCDRMSVWLEFCVPEELKYWLIHVTYLATCVLLLILPLMPCFLPHHLILITHTLPLAWWYLSCPCPSLLSSSLAPHYLPCNLPLTTCNPVLITRCHVWQMGCHDSLSMFTLVLCCCRSLRC